MAKEKFETLEEALEYIKSVNSDLKDEKEARKAAEAKLATEIADKNTLDIKAKSLQARLDQSEENCKELGKELSIEKETSAEALRQMAEMGGKLDLLEKNRGNNNLIVSVNGKSYELIGLNFRTKKGRLTAEQLSKDEELLTEMVEKKSGALIAID